MRTIPLHPAPRSSRLYPIVIGKGAIGEIPRLAAESGADGAIILCDERLAETAERLSKTLHAAPVIRVASGEASKSLRETERICAELVRLQATRQSLLVCIGGGMLTDLGGFVASIYMRGIRVVHVPTSLLSMVDAAAGGKTAVDLGNAKNLIGTIHQPAAVVVDINLLQTLPDPQLREGLVEVIKMAAILDARSFAWLEQNLKRALDRDDAAMEECIADAVRMKADVVGEDAHDDGKRLHLNFGHTVGHAVEALSQFAISHGRAVSIGMAREMAMQKTTDRERVLALLRMMDMPLAIPAEYDADALWRLMESDKKSLRGDVRIAVPTAIGAGTVRSISREEFRAARG